MQYYGASANTALARLQQYQLGGTALPGTTALAEGGEWLALAAAEVSTALLRGGYGAEPTATPTTNTAAYWILHDLISTRAALHYAASVQHVVATDGSADQWKRTQALLDAIGSGAQVVGELTPSGSAGAAVFHSGDETTDDLDEDRKTYLDEL